MKWPAAYLLMMSLALPVRAQFPPKAVPDCGFACFDSNRITLFADSSSFEKLFEKMDSVYLLGEGNLRIVHMGGSHVQAGTLTGTLRRNLLSLRPGLDGGRGLVFPFSAARTNNPSSFVTHRTGSWEVTKSTRKTPGRRLGLTGIAISTSDPEASVTLTAIARDPRPDDPVFRFNLVKVLGWSSGGDRVPVVVSSRGDTLQGVRSQVDSCWDFTLDQLSDSVRIAVAGRNGELTITGIFLDNPFPGITVSGIGINGASLAAYLRCPDLLRDLALVRPDLAILEIGVNDASGPNFSKEEFMQRYRTLVGMVRSVSPDCALLFVTNNDSFRRIRRKGYVVNRNGVLVKDAMMRLGKEYNAGVWDLFSIMGGLGSMKKWETAALAKREKIHFTEEGYEIVGNLLYNALMDRYVEHSKKGR